MARRRTQSLFSFHTAAQVRSWRVFAPCSANDKGRSLYKHHHVAKDRRVARDGRFFLVDPLADDADEMSRNDQRDQCAKLLF